MVRVSSRRCDNGSRCQGDVRKRPTHEPRQAGSLQKLKNARKWILPKAPRRNTDLPMP